MKDQPERDLVAELSLQLKGINGQHVLAGVNGNIPDDWSACDLTTHRYGHGSESALAVFCSAKRRDKPFSRAVGAKVDITPGTASADLERIADAMAEQLRMKIAAMRAPEDKRVRVSLADGARLPERKTAGASGYDLCALRACQVQPGRVAVIETGVSLEMPLGIEAQVRPRSGMASRGAIAVLGTVDSDFRAGVRVILANIASDALTINPGDRVAQLVFCRVELPELQVVDASLLTTTERGSGSLGSTGR